jgi:hypothetical protein
MDRNFGIVVISIVANHCVLHHSHSFSVNNFILNNPLIISVKNTVNFVISRTPGTKGLPDIMIFQILEHYT